MYSYHSSLEQPDIRRFPLEPYSCPHVVLGIYDHTNPETPAEKDDDADERQSTHIPALQELKKSYDSSQTGSICRLLALNATQGEDVLQVATDDQSTFKKAMQAVSCSLIYRIGQMSVVVPDTVFSAPQAPSMIERSAEHAGSQSDLDSRMGTPKKVERPSQISLQHSVVRTAPSLRAHGHLMLTGSSQKSNAKGAILSL